jgi:hypothetical protein
MSCDLRILFSFVLVVLVVLAMAGCGSPPVASVGPRSVHHVDARRIQGAYVPEGTIFTVHLARAMDTRGSPRGTPFTARLEKPLCSATGEVLVPAGSVLHGRLASVGHANAPRIRLDFDTVDTPAGPAPIQAAIRHAQYQIRRGSPHARVVPESSSYADDPFLYPYDRYAYGGPSRSVVGGGPGASTTQMYYPNEIQVPQGAILRLVLVRPLLPPGSTIRP